MILVVDDNTATLQVLAKALRRRGHDARTAPSGHAAMHFLSMLQPDLIILDMHMPGVDGLTILRKLRGDPVYQDTPVIGFSASPELTQEALEAGAQAAFVKGEVPWHHFLSHIDRAVAA